VNGGATPSYEWRVNGLVAGSGSTVTYTPSNGDQVVVTMTSSMPCVATTTAADTVVVTVNPLVAPSVTISDGIVGDTVCVGTVVTYGAVPVNGGAAPSYQWYVNGSLSGIGLPFNWVPANGDVITAVMTSSYACASPGTATSNSITMTVDITETPIVTIAADPGNTVCIGSAVTMRATGIYGGLTPFYRWTKNGVNVGTGRTYIYTPANGDNVFCMLASSSSCRTVDSVFSNHIIMSTISPVPPTVAISATPGTSVGIGDSVVLTASAAGATAPNYQWYVNSVAVPGANSSVFVYGSATATTAIITCVVGTGDACNATAPSIPVVVHVGTTGIKQAGMDNSDIQLLPNPNNGTFTIEGTMTFDNKEVAIEIVNAVGQVMYRDNATLNSGSLSKQVNTNNILVPGVYMLHLVAGNEHKVIRFSVSK